MRLTTFILIIALAQVSAKGFGQKITLNTNHTPIEKVLQSIRDQSGYRIFYDADDLKNQHVTLNINNLSVEEAIKATIKGLPLNYKIVKNSIVLSKEEPSFLERFFRDDDDGKLADIRGVVRNERGEALEGITVMVKGAKTGTRTNAKGEFVLKGVKKGDVLVFTGVAIESFEYTVKDDKNIDLNLKARLVQLEEVGINTGYQKISKERFVGSYSQLDSAAFHRRAGTGILERLDGTVTGVLFNKKGSNIPPVQIRGVSTLTESTSSPLIIVDNFPYNYDLTTINPNDIENVTVLKDAAAASIWGTSAGNGVIVITTKKGKFNQPLSILWNSTANIRSKQDLYYNPQISSSDFIDFEQFLFSKGAYNARLISPIRPEVSPVVDILNKIKTGKLSESEGKALIDQFRNIDYRDQLNQYVYQKRITQQHHLSLNGGTATMKYQLSVGYNHIQPDIQNSKDDDQITITSNTGFTVGKNININFGLNLSQSNRRSVTLPSFQQYPYLKLADANRDALAVPNSYRMSFLDTVGRGKLLDWQFRPLDEIKLTDQMDLSRTALFNTNIDYSITPWMKVGFQGQYRLSHSEGTKLNSLETYFTRNLINRFTNLNAADPSLKYPIPVGSVLNLSNGKLNGYSLRGNINIHKSWNDHQFNFMMAADMSENKSLSNQSGFYGYQAEFNGYNNSIDYSRNFITNFGGSERLPTISSLGDQLVSRIISLTGNASYSYQNKYMVYASARRDGSNVFGVTTNNKWKPLWSVGTSWIVSKEKFFKIPWVDLLSFKATYGFSGNVNNNVSGLLTIKYGSTPDELSGLITADKQNPPNPNLRWEEVKMFNSSMEFSIFKGRLTSSFEYWKKKSIDLISVLPFAPSTGVNTQTANAASLKGNGFDFNITGKVVDNTFKWDINHGLSYAKMKVVEVYRPNLYRASDFTEYGLNPAIGRIVSGLSSYRWAGLDPQNGDPRGYLNGQISKNYSEIEVDSVDKQIFHGSSLPLYSGFLLNRFSWKRLTLSFNVTYKMNFYFRRPALSMDNPIAMKFISEEYYNRWQKPGDEKFTNIPSFIYPSPVGNRSAFYANSEVNVLRGDHLRLQDFRVQYDVLKRYLFIKNFSTFIYLDNLNLILWKKNKSGLDPDFSGNGLNSPSGKTFTIGLLANL